MYLYFKSEMKWQLHTAIGIQGGKFGIDSPHSYIFLILFGHFRADAIIEFGKLCLKNLLVIMSILGEICGLSLCRHKLIFPVCAYAQGVGNHINIRPVTFALIEIPLISSTCVPAAATDFSSVDSLSFFALAPSFFTSVHCLLG